MPDQKPTPDHEGSKRPRFLQKLNPKATLWSVIRKAIIFAIAAAPVWWLLRLNPHWHPEPCMFVCWEVVAAIVGAVTEWQPLE
ncbi:MAG TPA: hypothetical protein VFW23_14700 [Tepidisphaeraceae bacterium]|nr:hypothetical protein [Tepidisphaeraceae bacterium]